ncbi:hypothetical protein N9B31_01780 [Mariniblastus sp.]|nr:hypothetical protein [Mariniblastus sp.]
MVDFKYLQKGIAGLANAHPLGTMSGHLGAAVAAGYFIGEDHADLSAVVTRGIESELERVLNGEEAIWFDVKKTGIQPTELFEIGPNQAAVPDRIREIAAALAGNVGTLKQSGHNVIFASIAIRALGSHEQYATPWAIDGVCKLIKKFNGVSSGRGYFGKKKGWKTGSEIELSPAAESQRYKSIQEMIDLTMEELIECSGVKKQGFGGFWHLINHAAGIVELDRLGYQSLAKSALPAHQRHLQLIRTLPDLSEELGPVKSSECDPLVAEYWSEQLGRGGASLTHRVKTIYGYHILRRHVEDSAVKIKSDEAFKNLMD